MLMLGNGYVFKASIEYLCSELILRREKFISEKYGVTVIGWASGGSEAALLAAEKASRGILIEI
jgi:hypothetical protein